MVGTGRLRPRDAWLVGGALGVAGLLALHSAVPNGVGRLGSLLETFLPHPGDRQRVLEDNPAMLYGFDRVARA